jgi:hypothetical protein
MRSTCTRKRLSLASRAVRAPAAAYDPVTRDGGLLASEPARSAFAALVQVVDPALACGFVRSLVFAYIYEGTIRSDCTKFRGSVPRCVIAGQKGCVPRKTACLLRGGSYAATLETCKLAGCYWGSLVQAPHLLRRGTTPASGSNLRVPVAVCGNLPQTVLPRSGVVR